jgi:mannose-1-phosphate guanylyltransferase
MKALLLAAGFGTRLRPLTNSIPKCLVPIKGKPLLGYWIDMLGKAPQIDGILINNHYLAAEVVKFIENNSQDKNLEIVFEEKLLGTGGTLLKNKAFFGEDTVMLIHADNLSKFNLNTFIAEHTNRPPGTEITMMTFDTTEPQNCGIVELDKDNIVIAFHEKVKNPPGKLANGAVYIIEPSILQFLESLGKEEIDFSNEVLPNYLGKINTFHNNVYHRDIGNIESYEAANKDFEF